MCYRKSYSKFYLLIILLLFSFNVRSFAQNKLDYSILSAKFPQLPLPLSTDSLESGKLLLKSESCFLNGIDDRWGYDEETSYHALAKLDYGKYQGLVFRRHREDGEYISEDILCVFNAKGELISTLEVGGICSVSVYEGKTIGVLKSDYEISLETKGVSEENGEEYYSNAYRLNPQTGKIKKLGKE